MEAWILIAGNAVKLVVVCKIVVPKVSIAAMVEKYKLSNYTGAALKFFSCLRPQCESAREKPQSRFEA